MTKVRKVKVNGGAWNDDSVTKAWRDRAEFTTSTKSLRGVYETAVWGENCGRLNDTEREAFLEAGTIAHVFDSPLYVVYSYATPIAWVFTNARGVERVHHVSQCFSVTTSKHQGRLY